jgi:predicted RNase H-like HicB family nuclease
MMQILKYVYLQGNETWLGYLEEYPDYWTQGESLDELIEHLKDLYLDVTSGQIPGIRRIGELTVS